MQRIRKYGSSNEQGIVSLMVTIILMLVISLIVISFAKTSRREQSDAFDRQLSTNAFYAAESGINAARNAITANPALLAQYTSDCGEFISKAALSGKVGPAGSNATYTCLFVDPTVSSIVHSLTSDPYSFPLKPAGNYSLGALDFYWDGGDAAGTDFTGCLNAGMNPTAWPAKCGAGVLRLELTDESNLSTNSVYFIYPSNNPGSHNITYNGVGNDPTGSIREAYCDPTQKPHRCHFQLTVGNTIVYARVSSLYMGYELTVAPNGGQKAFADAQVMIDATGKAADVQRRIQVRYNLNDYGGPLYLLQSGASMCKKFSLDGTNVADGPSPNCWNGNSYPTSGLTLP